jgi:hypothetical protein
VSQPAPSPSLPLLLLLTLGVLPSPQPAQAQEVRDLYRIQAIRVETGPRIDGTVSDPAWNDAAVIRDFIQQEPREGAPASERTEVRILYDADHLYIGIHAFDSDPNGVVATEMRRDSDRILEEDNVQIILDTFMDSRSAYMFVVNPLGARLDQQVFEEGEGGRRGVSSNVNRDWDGVWHAEARRGPDGWTAEIAIPLVTLRFPDAEPQSWGMNVMRNIRRKNEQVFWAPIPRAYGLTRVSLAGTLTDLHSLNRGRDLRIKPFVVSGGRRTLESGAWDNSLDGDVGLDVKYGLSASLNLDVTLNTDFAQAEADDERVNLTRFPLFFPEKRDFFLENAGQFNVGTTASTGRIADLFFSRRIGLSETGNHVPILAGARITGKVGANNIAAMNIQTEEALGRPGENFLVTRYSRDVWDRSRIGGMVINKQSMEGGHFNRTFAGDVVLAPHPNLTMNGFLARTATRGVTGDGMGGHFRAGWVSPRWNLYAEHTDLQDNFNPEVGFVPRTGIRTSKVHFERNPRPGRFGIRVMEPMFNVTYTTDQTGRLVTRQHHYMVGTRFENGAYLNIIFNDHFERLDRPFNLRPGIAVPAGGYRFGEWRFSFRSDPSRRLYHSTAYSPQEFFDGTRTDLDLSLGFRLTSQLSTEASYTRNDVDLQAGSFAVDLGALRVDYTLSPAISLRTLTQYNSLTRQWSTSSRLRYTYRPGSELYVVYDEVRQDGTALTGLSDHRDHQLIVKLTYLFSM